MDVAGLPIWGQLSIVGVLVSVIVLAVVTVLKGDLITKREQDRRDAKHAAEIEARDKQISEWRALWQASQDALTRTLDGTSKVVQTLEVFERFIQSLPSETDDDDGR